MQKNEGSYMVPYGGQHVVFQPGQRRHAEIEPSLTLLLTQELQSDEQVIYHLMRRILLDWVVEKLRDLLVAGLVEGRHSAMLVAPCAKPSQQRPN